MYQVSETGRCVTVNTGQGKTKVSVTKQPNIKKTGRGQKRKRLNSEKMTAADTDAQPSIRYSRFFVLTTKDE